MEAPKRMDRGKDGILKKNLPNRGSQHPSAPDLNSRKQAVPRASDRLHLNERKNRNMIKDNMMKVIFDNAKA